MKAKWQKKHFSESEGKRKSNMAVSNSLSVHNLLPVRREKYYMVKNKW